jgi:hypothetical protein
LEINKLTSVFLVYGINAYLQWPQLINIKIAAKQEREKEREKKRE